MRRRVLLTLSCLLAIPALFAARPVAGSQSAIPDGTPVTLPTGVEIVAAGLTNLRGFAWGMTGHSI